MNCINGFENLLNFLCINMLRNNKGIDIDIKNNTDALAYKTPSLSIKLIISIYDNMI